VVVRGWVVVGPEQTAGMPPELRVRASYDSAPPPAADYPPGTWTNWITPTASICLVCVEIPVG
jgi:hypothetical protein